MTVQREVDEQRGGAETSERRLTRRRCEVCEWEGDLVEPTGQVDADCPWCHGPARNVVAPLEVTADDGLAARTKNPHAAALGRLGGLKGGHARAAALSAKRRREIAAAAARARWAKNRRD